MMVRTLTVAVIRNTTRQSPAPREKRRIGAESSSS